ncbi:MAG TPA: nucleoid-associated protein [Thermoleophilia bacterium]|nr:nucleoid-associated protein [Thermoleophilia bacterium]
MAPDLGTLFVRHLIVHDIPLRRAADPTDVELTLSGAPAPDNTDVAHFFKERVTETLLGYGEAVYFVEDSGSPVPDLVNTFLNSRRTGDRLVAMSQQLAQHLHSVQNATNPAGLLTVCACDLAGYAAVAVLKLKREEGVRLTTEQVDGKETLSVEFLRQLMLTQETKLFKAALFSIEDDQGHVSGLLSDEQQPRKGPAAFFLNTFLGCDRVEAPDLLTKRFSDTALEFIRESVDDPELKSRYYTALQAELASNRTQIRPRTFIRDHVEQQHQDAAAKLMVAHGVPSAAFQKDTSDVKPLLTRKVLTTRRGIRISGSRAVFDDVVRVETVDGVSTVRVNDTVEEVG